MNKLLVLLCLILIPAQVLSQSIANYAAVRTTGVSYTSISTPGSSFSSWRNTSTSYPQDDNRSSLTDIGFDFFYNGILYTQFSVSTNGFIDFSSNTANGTGNGAFGYQNTAFTNGGSSTMPALAVMYDDLTAQGGVNALGSSIFYLVSGTAPNRVLTVEWVNMAVYNNTTPSLNFQVKLYETTGLIEYCYGTMTGGTANYTYTLGINAAAQSGTATAAQLKIQQSANGNTFKTVSKKVCK